MLATRRKLPYQAVLGGKQYTLMDGLFDCLVLH